MSTTTRTRVMSRSTLDLHGMCTPPAGSMVGTYKSMFPKSFFGTLPWGFMDNVSDTKRNKNRNYRTYVDDRSGHVEFRLAFRVHALHDIFLT